MLHKSWCACFRRNLTAWIDSMKQGKKSLILVSIFTKFIFLQINWTVIFGKQEFYWETIWHLLCRDFYIRKVMRVVHIGCKVETLLYGLSKYVPAVTITSYPIELIWIHGSIQDYRLLFKPHVDANALLILEYRVRVPRVRILVRIRVIRVIIELGTSIACHCSHKREMAIIWGNK